MGYWTSICTSHDGSMRNVSCGYHRGRGRNYLNFSSVGSGLLATSSDWTNLQAYLNWERSQRNLGAATSITFSGVITDDAIEALRDGIESISGAGNPDRPWTDGNGYSNAGGWEWDDVVQWQNIDDNDYNQTVIYQSTISTLRDRLNETMQDCVCNSDCGANSYCSCYTSYCGWHYVG